MLTTLRRQVRFARTSPVVVLLLGAILVLQVLIVMEPNCKGEYGKDGRGGAVRISKGDNGYVDVKQGEATPFSSNITVQRTDIYDTATCTCGLHYRIDPNETLVFPLENVTEKKFLTIAIPTIKRRNDSYLIETVKALISKMNTTEQDEVVIVIMLADLEKEKRQFLANHIEENLLEDLQRGLIHVIQPPEEYYASLKVTKRTYQQTSDYVHWRSKQNFDYAFLMRYGAPLSKYYMQLEDDVDVAANFLRGVRQYIDQQKEPWTCLEFCELGFIGKLYKSEDVDRLSQLLLMFFQEQPGDYIYLYFNMLMTQLQKRLRTPSLFQHKGVHSSFPGKIQPLKDRFFDQMEKKFKGDNPPAYIYTTLKTYLNFVPKLAYAQTEGYFWTDGSPSVGDAFIVVFEEPQTIDRVIVETGSESYPRDILENAQLLASLTILKSPDRLECTNDINLGDFQNGKIDVQGVNIRVNFKVMCLQIKVLKEQRHWAIIREIAVFQGGKQP